jgi:hypothetical protein
MLTHIWYYYQCIGKIINNLLQNFALVNFMQINDRLKLSVKL